MKMWKRVTQTLGDTWAPFLMGALLGTTGVLFMRLPISPTVDRTLGESIFGKKENPKVLRGELLLKVTGENTTDPAQN